MLLNIEKAGRFLTPGLIAWGVVFTLYIYPVISPRPWVQILIWCTHHWYLYPRVQKTINIYYMSFQKHQFYIHYIICRSRNTSFIYIMCRSRNTSISSLLVAKIACTSFKPNYDEDCVCWCNTFSGKQHMCVITVQSSWLYQDCGWSQFDFHWWPSLHSAVLETCPGVNQDWKIISKVCMCWCPLHLWMHNTHNLWAGSGPSDGQSMQEWAQRMVRSAKDTCYWVSLGMPVSL